MSTCQEDEGASNVTISGLEARSGAISHGLAVYRLGKVLDAAEQLAAQRALHEIGALQWVGDEPFEERSVYVAGPFETPDASHLPAFRAKLAETAAVLGIEAAYYFEIATELRNDAADENKIRRADAWKAGPPPGVTTAPFPVDGYPETLEAGDWEDFGIAVKLAGPACPGEHTVLDAFHSFWIRAYVDSEGETVPFRSLAVTFDTTHRAASLWIDNCGGLPATEAEIAQHTIWIATCLHQVLPLAHARLGPATLPHACSDGSPFVLAGNPVAARFDANGEDAAIAWLEQSSLFGAREKAVMCIELGCRYEPDGADGVRALRWFDRALSVDPTYEVAAEFAATALLHQNALDEVIERASRGSDRLRASTLFGLAEVHPKELERARAFVREAVLSVADDKSLAGLVPTVAEHAPTLLEPLLAALPARSTLVGYLSNAIHEYQDSAVKLRVWLRMLELPLPEPGPHRENFTRAFNNACVQAHAEKNYELAAQLADRAQPYVPENPYLPHSCACAYVAVGRYDDALEQVRRGIEAEYDFIERMEVDTDLAPILDWPAFKALFATWRERRARSEPIQLATDDTFDALVLQHDKPVLVDFTASWCRPCQALTPTLEKLAASSAGDFRVVKLDVDESKATAARYGVRSMPTLVVFRGGEQCARHVGLTDYATLSRLVSVRSQL